MQELHDRQDLLCDAHAHACVTRADFDVDG
jgi:hypothetical protein